MTNDFIKGGTGKEVLEGGSGHDYQTISEVGCEDTYMMEANSWLRLKPVRLTAATCPTLCSH